MVACFPKRIHSSMMASKVWIPNKQTKSDNNASQEIVLLQSTSQTSPVIFSTFLMTFDWIKLSLGHRSGRMMVFRRLRLRTYMHAGMYYVHMCSFQCRLETKRQAQVGHSGVKTILKSNWNFETFLLLLNCQKLKVYVDQSY